MNINDVVSQDPAKGNEPTEQQETATMGTNNLLKSEDPTQQKGQELIEQGQEPVQPLGDSGMTSSEQEIKTEPKDTMASQETSQAQEQLQSDKTSQPQPPQQVQEQLPNKTQDQDASRSQSQTESHAESRQMSQSQTQSSLEPSPQLKQEGNGLATDTKGKLDLVNTIGGSQTRRYLNKYVTPALLDGMRQIAIQQPSDPLRVLGEYLISRSEENK